MQQSTNKEVDILLEQWETMRQLPIPIPMSLDQALQYTRLKDIITELSHNLRISRLENNVEAEQFYIEHFCELYDTFSKDFIIKVLRKN